MLADEIKDAIDKAVFEALSKIELRAGTVVSSPFENTDDAMTVQFDGSSVATPVKLIRAFPVFPGMRVGLARFGSEWACIGAFSDPSTGTGAMRMTLGADVPPELVPVGVGVAMLFYVTELESGMEKGYFFIGLSNTLDVGNQEVCIFGRVLYPILGDPTSPTAFDVDIHFQMNLDPGLTVFKDYPITVDSTVDSVTFASGVELFLSGVDRITASENGVNAPAVTSGSDSTNSTSYVNLAGTGSVTSFTFEKRFTDTRIRVQIAAGFFPSAADNAAEFGVLIDGTDYTICRRHINPSLVHGQAEGTGYISGVPAGTYTVQGRWRRFAGSQNIQRNPSDWLSITAKEVN